MKLDKIPSFLPSLLIVLSILYLSLAKVPSPSIEIEIPNLDKIVHFIMYASLSVVLSFDLLRKRHLEVSFIQLFLFSFAIPVVIGGGVEILQMELTNYRSCDLNDFRANLVGAGFGFLVGNFLLRRVLKKLI